MANVRDAGEIVRLRLTAQAGHTNRRRADPCECRARRLQPHSTDAVPSDDDADRGLPFQVRIDGEPPGVVLTGQIKSLDRRAHGAERKERVAPAELAIVGIRAEASGTSLQTSHEFFGRARLTLRIEMSPRRRCRSAAARSPP